MEGSFLGVPVSIKPFELHPKYPVSARDRVWSCGCLP